MDENAEAGNEMAEALGRQVRMLRQAAGMTQDDLCERVGIFRTYLSRLENGIANPSLTVLCALAVAFKVKPWELLKAAEKHEQPTDAEFAARVYKDSKPLKVRTASKH